MIANEATSASRLAGLGISLDDGRLRRQDPVSYSNSGPKAVTKKADTIDNHRIGNTLQHTNRSDGLISSFSATQGDTQASDGGVALIESTPQAHDLTPELSSVSQSMQRSSIKQKRQHFSRKSVYLGPDSDASFEQKLNNVVKERIRRASLSPTQIGVSPGSGAGSGSLTRRWI